MHAGVWQASLGRQGIQAELAGSDHKASGPEPSLTPMATSCAEEGLMLSQVFSGILLLVWSLEEHQKRVRFLPCVSLQWPWLERLLRVRGKLSSLTGLMAEGHKALVLHLPRAAFLLTVCPTRLVGGGAVSRGYRALCCRHALGLKDAHSGLPENTAVLTLCWLQL